MKAFSTEKKSKIEQFGLEAVPIELQKTPWYRYAIIQIAIAANAGNFLVPALAVLEGGLSFGQGVVSTFIGAFLGFLLVSYLSLPGSTLGIPSQYAMRSILGYKGTRWLSSPIRSLTSLYWFGVQTIGGTYVIQQLVIRMTGEHIPFLFYSIPLSIIMVVIAVIGFDAVKKASMYFLPVLLLGEVVILYLYFTTNTAPASSHMASQQPIEGTSLTFIFFSSLAFVQYVSGVTASADMTRYAKSPRHGFYGLLVGNGIGFLITAIIGCASAAYFGSLNPYVSSSELTNSPVLIGIITMTAVISMISINISNAYTGGYSLLNTFSRLSRLQSAFLFGVLGVILSGIPVLVEEAETFIALLGGLIIPISAVICSDFLLVKKKSLHVESLKREHNLTALSMIFGGCGLYFFLPDHSSPGFIVFLVTFLSYPYMRRNSRLK